MRAEYEQGAKQDRLLAIAVPVDSSFGLTQGWQGWCEVPGGWRPQLVPANAARGASSYVVPPPNTGVCATGPVVAYTYQQAKACGQ